MRRKVGEKETQSNRGRYKRTQNRQSLLGEYSTINNIKSEGKKKRKKELREWKGRTDDQ